MEVNLELADVMVRNVASAYVLPELKVLADAFAICVLASVFV